MHITEVTGVLQKQTKNNCIVLLAFDTIDFDHLVILLNYT